ncbi:serine/threonine-protein kinase [Hyalangium rubrum]|uniref:Serine/threonine-protein kinase n=1 Tax=Hyalangium rubrum TaxID=3103134 RepID=A0ABU5HI92_9BACT|nr:serine/threonine-protein kinase [Hyalangium sp. s54d21]MDY7233164.1 serine/threonine-protein kinase [Hyalangium sp. s54d21]
MGGTTLPLAPDAFSGRMLGKYEVLCRLSTGGMAEIFLAAQRGLAGFRKLVVLKQILPDIKGEEEFVRMFLDEARVTAVFNHPHIAQVYDLDVADGELFLAMEFVQGATLVEVAKACRAANEPIPIGLSLAAARDTALALHYAHTFTDPLGRPASVIHRDVAEKNIMVTYEGVTKLLDFGIAKNLARKSRTQVGMVKGTSGYMSPEQILGEPLDPRSDLFSLGVVLHECLTGLRLFHAKNPMEGAGAVLQGQVPAPSRSNKSVPPELDAIVLRTLSRKREDRYASTLEFARALERAVGPLIWHPEQNAELIRRLFSERREQTRQLLMAGQALSGDATGEVRVSQIFSLAAFQQAPVQPEESTAPGLPQITPALNARPVASPALTALPTVKQPPPQPPPPPEPPKTPTPSKGAPAPRRHTSGMVQTPPASPESGAVRRPVFEPLPQKRSVTTPLPVNDALPPPPPPPDNTGNGSVPAWKDGNATRAAPPEEPQPRSEGRGRTLSRETSVARAPASERGEGRGRPSRLDMRAAEPPPPPARASEPEVESDEESTTQDVSPRDSRSGSGRPRSTSSERVYPPGNARNARRRAPTPPPEEEESGQAEIITHPVPAYRVEDAPPEDTNETHIPESEDGLSAITTPGDPPQREPRRWGLWLALACVGLLLVGGGLVVGLGLDGGRLQALASPPPATVPGTPEPVKPSTPPKSAAELTAQAPPPPANPPTPVTPPATPPPPAVTATSIAPAEEVKPSTPPVEPSVPKPDETPEPVAAVTPEPEEEEDEPAQQTRKPTRPPPPKRTPKRDTKAVEAEPPPSDWAPVEDKKDEAPASADSTGTFTLVTDPYAKVYLGKRYLGDTPLFKISLPSGKHSLRLVGPDGQNLRLPVEVKAGETTAVRIELNTLARE